MTTLGQTPPIREYRRKKGTDLWHWCPDCTGWPDKNYEVRFGKPTDGILDNECRALEQAARC